MKNRNIFDRFRPPVESSPRAEFKELPPSFIGYGTLGEINESYYWPFNLDGDQTIYLISSQLGGCKTGDRAKLLYVTGPSSGLHMLEKIQ